MCHVTSMGVQDLIVWANTLMAMDNECSAQVINSDHWDNASDVEAGENYSEDDAFELLRTRVRWPKVTNPPLH